MCGGDGAVEEEITLLNTYTEAVTVAEPEPVNLRDTQDQQTSSIEGEELAKHEVVPVTATGLGLQSHPAVIGILSI